MLFIYRVSHILGAELSFSHLPPQRGRDSGVTTEICQRLMETLGDNCQLPRGVDNTAGTLLHEQGIIGRPPVRVGGAGKRPQGKCPAPAPPAGPAENRPAVPDAAVPPPHRPSVRPNPRRNA